MKPQYIKEQPAHEWGIETLALHAGYEAQQHFRSAAVPIYQTTSFTFDNADHGAELFNLDTEGHIYSRASNPTLEILEKRMAALEGGVGAVAVASGNAATDIALSTLTQAGDHLIAATELYGGTYNILHDLFPEQRGIETTFVDKSNFAAIKKAIRPHTKAIFIESISNPSGGLADIQTIASIAHEAGIVLVVDNTVASPVLIRPIEHGADIVIHSATKYIGGHGNAIAGIIIDSGRVNWHQQANRYPKLTTASNAYHGITFTEKFQQKAYIEYARCIYLRSFGAVLSAHSAFLILQGLETLPLRMERIAKNTEKVAVYLEQHPLVAQVHHLSRPTHPDYHLVGKYLKNRCAPGLLSFELKGGRTAAKNVHDALTLFLRLVNIGDSKSLATIPAETTHRQLSDDALKQAGITPGLIRLSIGIETVDDLIADLEAALTRATL